MIHEKFSYKSVEEIQKKAEELAVHLPFAADTGILATPLNFGHISLPNRLGIAPMEGADSLADGSPSELTQRRYVREAIGQAGTIWFEAISIVPEGRSSSHQLMLTDENLAAYQRFTEKIKEATERLTKVFYDMSEQLYKNANPNGTQGAGVDPNAANGEQAGTESGANGNDGNVYDADYRVEDDKK